MYQTAIRRRVAGALGISRLAVQQSLRWYRSGSGPIGKADKLSDLAPNQAVQVVAGRTAAICDEACGYRGADMQAIEVPGWCNCPTPPN